MICPVRREFITLVGDAAAWPIAARAQQPERVRRIGVLMAYPEGDPEGMASVDELILFSLNQVGSGAGIIAQVGHRWLGLIAAH